MMFRQKRGQYSVEMIVLLFILLSLQLFFFMHFTDERAIIQTLTTQETADAQLTKLSYCLRSVEALGVGANCTYYLSEKIGGRNYTLNAYEDGPSLSLVTEDVTRFVFYVADLNQTYTNISDTGNIVMVSGEVTIS